MFETMLVEFEKHSMYWVTIVAREMENLLIKKAIMSIKTKYYDKSLGVIDGHYNTITLDTLALGYSHTHSRC
jgi:hypothetical protein